VANWFHRKAGLAIGITASGFGLGGLLVPVVTKLIDMLGWRTAMFVLGLGTLAIILPLSFLIRHKPEPYGYQPDGDIINQAKIETDLIPTVSQEVAMTARQAIRNRVFWHIAIGSMCHSFVIGAVVSIGGRLSSGWLADRFGSRQVFTASFVAMTAGLFLFGNLTGGMMWLIVPFILIFSLGWGCSVTSRITLLREYFGRGRFGTILGFLSGIMMLGSISGSPLAGWIFDTFGSYKGAWFGFSALTVVGAILVFTIPATAAAVKPPTQTTG
jgi:MFS family permease